MNTLKALREDRGYSLQALGNLCGYSKAHLWELEQPSATPTLKTAYTLAKILNVEVTDIWPNTIEIIEEVITVRRIAR